jgi:hypothetical protein
VRSGLLGLVDLIQAVQPGVAIPALSRALDARRPSTRMSSIRRESVF